MRPPPSGGHLAARCAKACRLPIGPYRRVPVKIHHPDPNAPEVARHLIALIATSWPATPAEHVGSSAVPGLAGKNIIDLLLAAEPADIPAITHALLELSFQRQVPAAFPASRPSRVRRRRSSGHHSGGRPRPCRWRPPCWSHNEQEDNAKRPNYPP